MSSIEAVISRARRPGAFSERQRFTLARSRAIQKMRHFALADPHYYVLELIQSAIASGAAYIDIRADEATITLSYLGGGVPEAGLANLFDFLFASKERGELSGLRALALGVNALMLFAPARIVIESGDGTLAGSARLEICGDQDRYDVGRPEQPLTGTYVRAEGLRRAKVAKELKLALLGGGADERSIIEQRCLTAPVPILFNQEPIFGHSTVRIPPAFGYRRSLAVDEGDLFGCLGLDPFGGKPVFRLLTYGVMVEAIEHELIPGSAIGGVINFDALRKTADHAKVVRDERLEELWVRLRPYAQQLRRGGSAAEAAYDVRIHGGGAIPAAQLRSFLRELGRVVVIDPATPAAEIPTARRIAAAMDAELLVAPASQVASLRILGGRDVTLLTPSLSSPEDVEFYTGAPAEAPARPWLIAPIEAPTLPAVELQEAVARALGAAGAGAAAAALGERGEVRVTVYSPASRGGGAGEVLVRLWSLGREVSRHVVATGSSGGMVAVAEIPELSPARLRARCGEASVGERVAEAIAEHAAPQLAEASRRALLALVGQEIRPGTAQARLALAELVRTTIVRLRREGEAITVALTPLRTIPGLDLLSVPIVATLDGRPLAARDLVALLDAGHGVLYGVVPEVPADLAGLDRGRILDLDAESEALLVALVGEGAYVRVDGRERLAERDGFVIRDLAWGLGEFPAGPLLIEGGDPGGLAAAEQAGLEEALFAQVLQRYVEAPPAGADWAAEEARRQALRHVQRYLCLALARGDAQPLGVDLVVALGPDRRGYSMRQILATMREGPLVLHYDHGALPPPIDGIVRGEGPPAELLASPFFARLLAAVGAVALAFDVALPGEAVDVPKDIGSIDGLLVAEQVAEGEVDGVLGIPRAAGVAPRIALLDRDHRVVHVLAESARDSGASGVLRVRTAAWNEGVLDGVAGLLARVGDRLLERLGAAIGGLSGEARARATGVLLDHAGRHLMLVADASGRVVPELTSPRAAAILELPLFPGAGGLPVRGAWVIQRCCEAWASGRAARGRDFVSAAAEPELVAWLDAHVDAGRVARLPSRPARPPAPASTPPPEAPWRALSRSTLVATVERHFNALRPDPPVVGEVWRPRALVRADDEATIVAPLVRVRALGGTRLSIELNPWHWLAEWAREVGNREPEAIAWLLLAIYAEALRVLDDGAAEHEAAMQRRVAEALERGELRPVHAGVG